MVYENGSIFGIDLPYSLLGSLDDVPVTFLARLQRILDSTALTDIRDTANVTAKMTIRVHLGHRLCKDPDDFSVRLTVTTFDGEGPPLAYRLVPRGKHTLSVIGIYGARPTLSKGRLVR